MHSGIRNLSVFPSFDHSYPIKGGCISIGYGLSTVGRFKYKIEFYEKVGTVTCGKKVEEFEGHVGGVTSTIIVGGRNFRDNSTSSTKSCHATESKYMYKSMKVVGCDIIVHNNNHNDQYNVLKHNFILLKKLYTRSSSSHLVSRDKTS